MRAPLEAFQLIAFNTALDSENKIHDPAVAAQMGFRSGLVPGVEVYGYLCHAPLAYWGEALLSGSRCEVRFTEPIYDGEPVTIVGDVGDDGILRAEAHTDNKPRSWLTAQRSDHHHLTVPPPASAPAPTRSERLPANEETLSVGTVLGSFPACCTRADLDAYLAEIDDRDNPMQTWGVTHPGWILRLANDALTKNVVLKPWIHVGSTIEHRAPVRLDETVTVRSVVTRQYEHKGHRFVGLTVAVGDDDRVVIDHTAIYEPRTDKSS